MAATPRPPSSAARGARGDRRRAAALRAGPPRIVAVEGEPGIGKSLLLARPRRAAAADGCAVLAARATEFQADLPYALLDARRWTRTSPPQASAGCRASAWPMGVRLAGCSRH